jgi:hypothetical protein
VSERAEKLTEVVEAKITGVVLATTQSSHYDAVTARDVLAAICEELGITAEMVLALNVAAGALHFANLDKQSELTNAARDALGDLIEGAKP